MRTCVGAWEPATLLLLGLVLGARAVLNCVGNTYPNGHRCCQECQPEDLAWPKKGGTGLCSPEERPAACPQAGLGQPANVPSSAAGSGMVSRCEGPRDTVCLPCGPDSYNEAVNYEACKPCTQCNQTWAGPASSTAPPAPPGSGSELKKKCTPTQDTVCSCRPGTQPLGGFKHGVGVTSRVGLPVSSLVRASEQNAAGVFQRPSTRPLAPWGERQPHRPQLQVPPGSGLTCVVFAADCAPCPPGYFSPGDNKACRPWTNCTSTGRRTLQPGSRSSDTLCENRTSPGTLPWETQGPTARPTTAPATVALPGTSLGPSTPPSEAPRGLPLAAVLGLGLSLLAPLAALLALHLHRRAWRPPGAPKPPASGPPFKRSKLMHTPPWPRFEQHLGGGLCGAVHPPVPSTPF
ncbi:tumor necrosis factor receptor superfamily member 4 isoform X3 [Sciurus carolinensis]|uniref:tumor necrosis factor receptor superfamily member 4 isoform X3 n=1 Tax=Sciurus carolinensis TaxID=30640 RepID=UPI001FB2DA73|nr:tumor necrosis factor receptor superfamily member 4 isoform X3 [Sciurus carolinensis]